LDPATIGQRHQKTAHHATKSDVSGP
jgi:hypothetical protein